MKFDLIGTLKGISVGLYNSVVLNEQVEEMAKERLSICARCPHNSEVARAKGQKIFRPDNHCLDCGCDLVLKTRYPAAECPLGGIYSKFPDEKPKWKALTTNEEGDEIINFLDKQANGK